MDHIHQVWEWWYNGGRVPFFGKAVCILCIIFVPARSVKEARLRFSNTALPK